MEVTIYHILLLILAFLIIYYLQSVYRRSGTGSEHFENGSGSGSEGGAPYTDRLDYKIAYRLNDYQKEVDDIFDPEYVGLYAIAYHDFHDIDRDVKKMKEHITRPSEEMEVVVGGCGVGKMLEGLKRAGYSKILGVDFSKHMLEKARSTYPHFPYVRGNLADPKILEPASCDLFVMDERTLYMNDGKDMEKILKNMSNWVRDGGYIVLPVYHRDKLQPACRYYSTNYIDNLGVVHAMTYLDQFRHDGWYIHDIREGDELKGKEGEGEGKDTSELTVYFDKFLMKEGPAKKRVQTTMFNFINPVMIYQFLKENKFERVHIEPICNQIVGGYELAIYKKGNTTATVQGIQKREGMRNQRKKGSRS